MTTYDMLIYLLTWGMFLIGVLFGYVIFQQNPNPGEAGRWNKAFKMGYRRGLEEGEKRVKVALNGLIQDAAEKRNTR